MKTFSLTACMCILFSCHQGVNNNLVNGIWKIRKVEILKDRELQKVIDTGYQCWSFKKNSLIEIFDLHKIQNILHVEIGGSTIRSYDIKGALQDEFIIEEIDNENLALSSKKEIEGREYNVIYYLDKIKDSVEKISKQGD